MTAAEMGVYITIIAMIYERAGPIKADDTAKLARLCGTSASALKGILERLIADEKLTLIDGMISNRRAELVIKNVMSKSEVARASVEARWAKRSTKSISEEYERNTDAILTKAKAKDKKDKPNGLSKKGCRLPDDWIPKHDDWHPARERLGYERAQAELDKFYDYWRGVPGNRGVKLDWDATWRNWVRKAAEQQPRGQPPPKQKYTYVDAMNEILEEMGHERQKSEISHGNVERLALDVRRTETETDDVFGGGQ
jgi:uncharacterized protein YdaU (DUF1376 family)